MAVLEVTRLFGRAAEVLAGAERRLCEIDAETGDGDHGIAMARVAETIMSVSRDGGYLNLAEYFSAVSASIMSINGGSCIPLWASMFDGMAEAAEACAGEAADDVRRIFQGALEGVGLISDAKSGDKTMVDALAPAVRAAQDCLGSVADILDAAARAAEEGAAATRDMAARFGRAKNLKEGSLGHLDAGAVSVSVFIRALARGAGNEG